MVLKKVGKGGRASDLGIGVGGTPASGTSGQADYTAAKSGTPPTSSNWTFALKDLTAKFTAEGTLAGTSRNGAILTVNDEGTRTSTVAGFDGWPVK